MRRGENVRWWGLPARTLRMQSWVLQRLAKVDLVHRKHEQLRRVRRGILLRRCGCATVSLHMRSGVLPTRWRCFVQRHGLVLKMPRRKRLRRCRRGTRPMWSRLQLRGWRRSGGCMHVYARLREHPAKFIVVLHDAAILLNERVWGRHRVRWWVRAASRVYMQHRILQQRHQFNSNALQWKIWHVCCLCRGVVVRGERRAANRVCMRRWLGFHIDGLKLVRWDGCYLHAVQRRQRVRGRSVATRAVQLQCGVRIIISHDDGMHRKQWNMRCLRCGPELHR